MPAPRSRVLPARSLTSSGARPIPGRSRERPRIRAAMRVVHASAGPELREETQVVLEEQAQVIHAVTKHRQAIDAHAEGVAGILFRIDPAGLEHARMHHPAARDLEPAGVFADA